MVALVNFLGGDAYPTKNVSGCDPTGSKRWAIKIDPHQSNVELNVDQNKNGMQASNDLIPTRKVSGCDPHQNYKVSDWNRSSSKERGVNMNQNENGVQACNESIPTMQVSGCNPHRNWEGERSKSILTKIVMENVTYRWWQWQWRGRNNDDNERPCKVVLMTMKVGWSSVDEDNKRCWKMMMSKTRQWRWWGGGSFSTRNDCDYGHDGVPRMRMVRNR